MPLTKKRWPTLVTADSVMRLTGVLKCRGLEEEACAVASAKALKAFENFFGVPVEKLLFAESEHIGAGRVITIVYASNEKGATMIRKFKKILSKEPLV